MNAPLRGIRWRHPPYDYLLSAEAVVWLAIARLAVELLAFSLIVRWMARSARKTRSSADARRIAAAVNRAARRVPWRAVCIHQGIAAQRMLRRRGIESQFVYGLKSGDEMLEAHVWVKVDGDIVIGGEMADHFEPVAIFPGSTPLEPPIGAI